MADPDLKIRLSVTKEVTLSPDDDLLEQLHEKLIDDVGCEPGSTPDSSEIERALRSLWEEDPSGLLELDSSDLQIEVLSGSIELPSDNDPE